MNNRFAYIENRRVLQDSGEITSDVAIKDPITSIFIEFRATNGGTSNVANLVAACVSSVELIDGGRTLYSLTGKQLAAQTYYHRGYIPYTLISEIAGNTQNLVGELQFGRWHGDTVYAFDPSRFSNPQLRIKWNLAAVRAVAATAFLTGSMTFTAIAQVMEGAALPQGMLTMKQHYSFTTAASGDETVEIPTDQRLKAIMVASESDTGGGLYGLSNLKLTGDEDKLVVFDMRTTDIQRLMTMKNPPFMYKHFVFAKNADVFYPILKQDEAASFNAETGDTVISYVNYGIGTGALAVTTGGVAAANRLDLTANVHGWMPFHAAWLDQGEFDDPASWFDTTSYRRLRLKLTQDAANATAAVVLEQEYVY
jgi:hypothetical protein